MSKSPDRARNFDRQLYSLVLHPKNGVKFLEDYSMTMEDVWVETVHEEERRDRKKNENVTPQKDEKTQAQDRSKRPAARKDNRQQEKRAA
jgi:hypothetical protein